MTSRTKVALTIFGILSGALILAGASFALDLGPWRVEPAEVDLGPVIARVDGQPVYLHEAEARIAGLSSVHGDVEEMLGDEWQDRILSSLVADQVLREEAESRGIRVTTDDIESYERKIEETIGPDQTLDGWLAEQGLTLAELERRAELQIIGARVYLAVTNDVRVTGEDLREYYRSHRSEFEEVDGTVPSLLEVRRSLRRSLLDMRRDEAYAAWLDEARANAEVVVVMDDWWRNL